MEKISVSIRVRPLEKQEAAKGSSWKINNNAITLLSASGAPLPNQIYVFDHVFGTDSTTFDIYRATTEDIVASAVKGFNGTVFAYGQTSSGKTFTMRGTQDTPGIIPLAVHDVFKNLEQAVDREFLLRISYMEIYNEDINDLLAPEQTKLQVHESLESGIFVAGLREEIVANPEQVLQLMEFGEAHRHIGETNMNVHSSRSHTIFRMVIESRDKSQDDSFGFSLDAVRVSVLNLVDLAGSERVAKTGAEGARLKEGTHINKSLMVLGTVINKLSEGIQNQGGHVPYRDSKLTRILQPALGGNARTAVICNITPATVHVDESRGTLQFASRAIRVTNCAKVNEILTDAALLKRQKKEIEELRSKLKESHSEHLEEEILTLRNTLLKSECERERIALELQEEKKAHAEQERKQAQKIENLSTLVLNSTVDERDFEKRSKKNSRRETWCPRVTTGNILDEDASKPLKEDRWAAQNRDRLFPMPPPFESLLEEDESFNGKDATEVQQASPQHQERHGSKNDKGLDGSCGALPELSARIHVADRKRKYRSEISSLSEVRNDFQMFAEDSGVEKIESVSSPKEGKRGCQSQQTEKSDSLHHKDEGDVQIYMDGDTVQRISNDSMIQQLSQELSKANEEVFQYKNQLAMALEELQQLKNQAQVSVKDTNQDIESLLKSLRKEKEELAIQLTEAYLQFEEEKAAWLVAPRKISTTNVPEDDARVESLQGRLKESQEEVCAVKVLAEKERLERLSACNEVKALKEKLADFEREFETLKASEVAKESISLKEDCDGPSLITEEIWRLKTENLKLQVSLDATIARAEVFHGRLLESQDDLNDVREELDHLKGSNKELDHPEADATMVGCVKEQNSSAQIVSSNTTQNNLVQTERIQTFEKEHGECKLLEAREVYSSGKLAHTVSFPMRSTAVKRPEHNDVTGETQVQRRPRLSTLNGNAPAGNRVTIEVDSMPPARKSSVFGAGNHTGGLKPLKELFVPKNPSRSKGWHANIHNKENR